MSDWLNKCLHWKEKWPICDEKQIDPNGPVDLYYFTNKLSTLLPEKSAVVSDAGSAIYVPGQALKLKGSQRFILSAGQAEMGFAVPASVGVSFANPNQRIAVITGDGSFQTNIQELAVITCHRLPITIFVWNNGGYLSIKNTQDKFFGGRRMGTSSGDGLWFPELVRIATAYQLDYWRIDNNSQVDKGIKIALSETNFQHGVICEVICKADQKIEPTITASKNPDGTLRPNPLHNMFPFLSEEELKSEMIANEKDHS